MSDGDVMFEAKQKMLAILGKPSGRSKPKKAPPKKRKLQQVIEEPSVPRKERRVSHILKEIDHEGQSESEEDQIMQAEEVVEIQEEPESVHITKQSSIAEIVESRPLAHQQQSSMSRGSKGKPFVKQWIRRHDQPTLVRGGERRDQIPRPHVSYDFQVIETGDFFPPDIQFEQDIPDWMPDGVEKGGKGKKKGGRKGKR
eukprot:TRINITY_DN13757_c0_g1_i1.p1 TRINITY_DN13757_c0_g1~~TRINITY_DN13757_c0_g1_i1.p1  ORF type:complete len:199 (+),score=55.86 TRINITY_DN13757_c0_g1_i1:416-1012(+)